MTKKTVCVIEDDRDINDLIVYHLNKEGYSAFSLFDGANAIDFIRTKKPDLILLDLMLPEVDGLEICRLVRFDPTINHIPIIMLTAKGEESDIIVGLQIGADDYLAKPFSPKVLLARIKSVIRRCSDNKSTPEAKQLRQYGDLTLDLLKHKLMFKTTEIILTAIEFDILEFLSRQPGRVFSRDQILNGVWKDGKFIIDRAVDVHIRGLRKKLGPADYFIETVRGTGYRFKETDT